MDRNALFFGDNLHVLRERVADASVDLIYLDPPFNSKRDYNLLFKTPKPAKPLAERDKHQFQLWACGLVNAQPYQGGRKGADRGIDGLLYIEVGKKTEKVIVQVKGGAHVGRANIATLKGDVEREKAAVGLFVTLAEPTREMSKEAVAAGHYESPFHGAVPRIQILSVEELLAGKKPQLPDLSRGEQTFKKARKEDKEGRKQQSGFDF